MAASSRVDEEKAARMVARILSSSRHAVAFTGAGVSAESGIPTFRGEDGLWRRSRPEELATPEAFSRDPLRVWQWYAWRMRLIAAAKPNEAHMALARMEEAGITKAVITQNVDGLHQKAGSKRVVELHGNIWRVLCTNRRCGYRGRLSSPPERLPPTCPRCGALLRPDVVWFGEPLPRDAWSAAEREARRADAMLIIGTSGVVYPAAYIPLIAREHGAVLVEVNVSDTPLTPLADIHVRGRAARVLGLVARYLGIGPL